MLTRRAKAVAVGGAVLGAIGLAALASHLSKAAPTLPRPAQRIALIGDSYAVGIGPELAKIIPTLRGEGHVGTGTLAWANHTAACGKCGDWIPNFKPDLVLVSLGVNDGKSPDQANYQAIVRALHGMGARVIWIEPPADVNTPAVRRVITSLGVPTVPATTVPLAADGLHPRADGYATWAHEIAEALR